MIHYYISYQNPLTSFLQIKVHIQTEGLSEIYLQLPAWRPGRYELQNFAQKIQSFQVVDRNNNPLYYQKITKDRWVIQVKNQETIEIHYNFYARQMDAGGSWLDETQLYINPVNCLMAVEGQEDQACQLHVAIPPHWQIASGLNHIENNVLQASNYDELADSPLIASPTLQHQVYKLQNILFHVWFQGDCKPTWDRLLTDFEKFTKEQLQLFGEFPVPDYHFLIQILPYRFYHGVEHSNSTVIALGPGELLMAPEMYKELLGVSCHELFHTWNIKQIRPLEMMPYDYSRENYFRTGYVAEGITTYYGDYLLARCGVFSVEQYFAELNEVFRKHFDDFGQHNLSVADSSFDLWLDGYKPGIPDRKVSIYHKGCIAALILDLEIRRLTNNAKSLDDLMRRLWQEFGKPLIGYTEQDYQRLAEEVAGQSLHNYFDEIIYSTVPVQASLNQALHYVGCTLQQEPNGGITESKFGFRTAASGDFFKVTYIEPNSPAAHALSVDDELIAVNGRKLEESLLLFKSQDLIEVSLFRNKKLRTIILQADGKPHLIKYTIQKLTNSTPDQKQNFELWLKQKFDF